MTPWLSTTVGAIGWTGCDVLLAEYIAKRLRQITTADACRDDNTIDSHLLVQQLRFKCRDKMRDVRCEMLRICVSAMKMV